MGSTLSNPDWELYLFILFSLIVDISGSLVLWLVSKLALRSRISLVRCRLPAERFFLLLYFILFRFSRKRRAFSWRSCVPANIFFVIFVVPWISSSSLPKNTTTLWYLRLIFSIRISSWMFKSYSFRALICVSRSSGIASSSTNSSLLSKYNLTRLWSNLYCARWYARVWSSSNVTKGCGILF